MNFQNSIEHMLMPSSARLSIALLLAVSFSGCSDDTTGPFDLSVAIELASGDQQVAEVGGELPEPIVVRVTDPAGDPLSDRQVDWGFRWSSTEGVPYPGTIEPVGSRQGPSDPSSWTTDDQGYASARVTLGPIAGEYRLTAHVEGGGAVEFRATATLPPGMEFAGISAGYRSTCGVTEDERGYCWGEGTWGQLGNGSSSNQTMPRRIAGDFRFLSISIGNRHACGVTREGRALCWGQGGQGELGHGSSENRHTPHPVVGELTFSFVETGAAWSCGLTTDGRVYCWGRGELSPQPVSDTLSFGALSVGSDHACGTTSDSELFCWGVGYAGKLGTGSEEDQETPGLVSGGHRFFAFSAGALHTCGLANDGKAYCWGRNLDYQLGTGSNSRGDYPLPQPVWSDLDFSSVNAGGRHTCAVNTGGEAYCWGDGGSGRLGTGSATTLNSSAPKEVIGGLVFERMTTGGMHTCGLTTDGQAYCWGANATGQLGSGSDGESHSTPQPVARP